MPPAPPAGPVNHPLTSTRTSVLPDALAIVTPPPDPNATITRLGTVSPAAKLRFEVPDQDVPSGKAARKPPAVGLTAVTLRATAVAPDGTEWPASVTVTRPLGGR